MVFGAYSICVIIKELHTKKFENPCMPRGLGCGVLFRYNAMAIKRSSPIEKFLLKNPTSNASNDLNFRNIFIEWTKICDKTLFGTFSTIGPGFTNSSKLLLRE